MKLEQGKTFSDKLYCTSPFNSLFIQVDGMASSCCASSYNWGNIKRQSIDDIINGDIAQDVRKDILAGNKTRYCDTCVRQEGFSGTSERTHFSEFLVDTDKEFELKSLDLRWSNICNFSCMYCTEDFSSSWAKKKGLPSKVENLKYQDNILKYIENNKNKVGKILLAGGEPLLQMQNEKLLDIVSPHTRLTIITNMGIDLKKSLMFKKISKLKNVLWSISIENYKDEFEYVRQGGSWQRLLDNINYIREVAPHQEINFLSVFSIFTIENLVDFIKFAESQNVNILWQSVFGNGFALHPEYFSNKVRSYIISKLDDVCNMDFKIDFNKVYLKGYRDKIEEMMNNNTPYIEVDKKFRNFIKLNEEKYNDNNFKFELLWPELDSIISKD